MLVVVSLSVQAKLVRSDQDLKFYELLSFDRPSKYLGFTSSKLENVVEVPFGDSWFIRPDGRMTEEQYLQLIEEIRVHKYPGFDVSDRWDVSNKTLQPLAGISTLKILHLSNTRVTDSGLAVLAKLPALEVLALNNQTTSAGLKHLKTLARLRSLELKRSRVTDQGLEILKDLPHLQMLDLSDTAVTDAGAKVLAQLTNLRQLDISHTKITDKGVALLATLPKLEVLYTNSHMTDNGIASLARAERLRSLDISGARVTSRGLRALTQMKRLEALALSDTFVGDDAMEFVGSLKKLKTLELSGTYVTYEGLMMLLPLQRLETLSVGWKELSGSEIAAMRQLKRLERVILNGRTIDRDILSRVKTLAKKEKKPRGALISTAPTTDRLSAPDIHPGRKVSSSKATIAPKPASFSAPTVKSFAPTKDVSSSGINPAPIALAAEPQGQGMIIEVSAAPRPRSSSQPRRLTGLKRLHQLEIGTTPEEMGLQPGAEPVIGGLEPDPKNSLGEIRVNAR